MSITDKLPDVAQALQEHGFKYLGRAKDGWLRHCGDLNANGQNYACELAIDPQLFELPRIRLLQLPAELSGVPPHIGSEGALCYIAKGTVVLDIFDPVGQTLACIKRAEEVLTSVLQGKMVDDLEEEFYVYWQDSVCLVDMQGTHSGQQQALLVKLDGNMKVIVTDDETRTASKLKALGWTTEEGRLLVYRVNTVAKPRPRTDAWPPTTVSELLTWQGLLDTQCRRKIEQRLWEGLCSKKNGVIILVESPLMTYAVAVLFKREKGKKTHFRPSRTFLYESTMMRLAVVRIDDRYLAQRNIPGKKTLAGKNIALVGCGTIGGYLATMLVKAGAGTCGGKLTLVDFDWLYPQNIGRHYLGFSYLFQKKATALAEELVRIAPDTQVCALPVDVRSANLGKVEFLIDATGEEALGHWLCQRYPFPVPMLSTWIEGPGTAVRALLRSTQTNACFRCLCEANRIGKFTSVVGSVPSILAGQGCEGLYVPFSASVSTQAAALASEAALDWANGTTSPALRTRLVDYNYQLATPDCDPPRLEDCQACHS